MNVTIIGHGNMAKGIGIRLIAGGHSLSIHTRKLADGEALASELRQSGPSGASVNAAEVGAPTDEIVILAVPYTAVEEVAKQYGGLSGKIVVDITNPVDFATFQLIPDRTTSGAEEIARLLPNARLIKAFNTVLAGPLVAGSVESKPLDVFIASDDAQAKDQLRELVASSGMRPIDVGPLENSRHLEGFALIHMAIQEQLGTNWMSSLKILG